MIFFTLQARLTQNPVYFYFNLINNGCNHYYLQSFQKYEIKRNFCKMIRMFLFELIQLCNNIYCYSSGTTDS